MILRAAITALVTLLPALPVWASDSSALDPLTHRADLFGLEAVGRLDSPNGFCSATLIASDLVLTAAHCVYNARTGEAYKTEDLIFRAALTSGTALAERRAMRIAVDPAYTPTGALSHARVAADVALILLDQPISSAIAAPFALHSSAPLDGPVSVVSYGRGRTENMSWQRACNVLARDRGVLVMDCNVTYGSSGSAIFARENGRYRIVSLTSAIGRYGGKKVAYGMELPEKVSALKQKLRATPARRSTAAKRISVKDRSVRSTSQARFVKVKK